MNIYQFNSRLALKKESQVYKMEIFFFTDKWMDENGHQYVL